MNWARSAIGKAWRFYFEGFRDLSAWGRKLWIIILIKLFIIFAIIRLFFMPDVLKRQFNTDVQRSQHVIEQLTTYN